MLSHFPCVCVGGQRWSGVCQIPSVPPKVHVQSAGRKQHRASGTADLNLWVVTPTGGVAYQIPWYQILILARLRNMALEPAYTQVHIPWSRHSSWEFGTTLVQSEIECH